MASGHSCPYSVCRDCGSFAHKAEAHTCHGGVCHREASHERHRELRSLRAHILATEGNGRPSPAPRRLELRREYNAKLQAHRHCRCQS